MGMCRFGYKYLIFIAVTFIILFKINFISYAGIWSNESNGWYYIKDNNEKANDEILLDESGEIYCFDNTGLMLHESFNKDGLYFSSNGAWLNPISTNKEKFDNLWDEYIKNNNIIFSSKSELVDALNYFSYTKFITIPRNVSVINDENNFILTSSSLEKDLNILNQYSVSLDLISLSLKDDDDFITIQNIIDYIVDNGNYATTENSAYSILSKGLGCCTSYSQLFNKLCDNLGYTSETIFVYIETGLHCLNRVLLNNVWYYYDVTFYDESKDSMYLNIDKDIFLQIYKLADKGIFSNK